MACDYPAESDVRFGVVYADGTMTGTLFTPPTPDAPVDGMSPFAAIAYTIKLRLTSMTRLDPAWVLVVASDKYRITVAENFFVYCQWFGISQPRDPGLEFTNSGAGRLSVPIARRMRVYVYTRSGTDVYGDDSIALMGTSPGQTFAGDNNTGPAFPGQFVAEEVVFNALVNWTPLDDSGNALTLTPLHPLDASEQPQRPPENEAGLLRSCLDFEVVYQSCMDPTEPAPQVT